MPSDPIESDDQHVTKSVEMDGHTESFQSFQTAEQSSHVGADAFPVVPGYEIVREIDRGGMGRVLAAREVALDREVAIKVLLPGANVERFVTESRVTAKIPHPGIPPIYSIGTLADGSPYLAMKFVRGQNLSEALKTRSGAQNELPRFIQVFEQVCHAVGFAHSQSIIHRDLKPVNIMMGAFGEVQVLDWGLAKELRTESGETVDDNRDAKQNDAFSELTVAGTVMGTPSFMAPEQARGESVDARADVFALGGILCNILTGQAVHSGDTVHETIQKAASGNVSEAFGRLDSCSADADLVSIAKKCLASSRDDRPSNGQDVAVFIAAYRQGVEERLHRAETDRASALVREGEQRKQRKLFYGLGGAVAAVLVLGIIGTSIGLVRANRAADAERIAKDEAIENKMKSENRLAVIRSTVNKFTYELPAIGSELPLSDSLRQELLEVSRTLIDSIGEQTELQDTYQFGKNAIAIRESLDASARGDATEARKKLTVAVEGFQRALDLKPKMIDRSRNNLAMALTELGRLDRLDQKFEDADARFEKALALRRQIVADPHEDLTNYDRETALASTLMMYGNLEVARNRFDSAIKMFDEAGAILTRNLAIETNRKDYERLRLSWVRLQVEYATTAFQLEIIEKDEQKKREHLNIITQRYEAIVKQLIKDVEEMPNSASFRRSLAMHSAFLGMHLVDRLAAYQDGLKYIEIGVHNRRWFWNRREIFDLEDNLGSSYYQLGVYASRNKQPEAARKHFRNCLAFWDLAVRDLEDKGEPEQSTLMIDRKIVRFLAQGRCGMHAETAAFAAELYTLSKRSVTPEEQRARQASINDYKRIFEQDYAVQSTVGFGFCAIAFPEGSPERIDYYKKAMISLNQALTLGFKNWHYLETDADMDPMHEWPEYKKTIDEWKAKDKKNK